MSKRVHLISMENITKAFGSVVANKNISFQVCEGEIHAVLGENGAGKSTLMNMLSGVYTPDSGFISIHGKKVRFSSPKDAIKAGIGMIYQHFKLIDAMSARDNIILGQNIPLFKGKKNIDEKINNLCQKYGIHIDLDKLVCHMSVGEKQILEIIKVLYRGANIFIFDEPTTVFTPQDVEKLFNIMRKMKENGCAIIFITHKLEEVMTIADRITVLRKGETVKTLSKEETTPKDLAELMVGRTVDLAIKKSEHNRGKTILGVKNLRVCDGDGSPVLKNISFQMYQGEILGIAGIAGSGQKELCEGISGICKINQGEILFKGENIAGKSPREILSKGITMSFIPEDRLGMGLVASMDMVENLMLKSFHKSKGIFINRKPLRIKAKEIKKNLDIKTPSIYAPIKNLSGGNIQKILLGRELDTNPEVLIMAYPVRGLDINTCYGVYDLINKQRAKGVSVLFIGEDLDVLMQLCDRVMVLCHGEVAGIVDPRNCEKKDIGLLMAGGIKTKVEEEIA